jgi:hypothetical protein
MTWKMRETEANTYRAKAPGMWVEADVVIQNIQQATVHDKPMSKISWTFQTTILSHTVHLSTMTQR